MTYYYEKQVSETTNYTLQREGVLSISYQPDDATEAKSHTIQPAWHLAVDMPYGLSIVPQGAAWSWAGAEHFARDGVAFKGWNLSSGAMTAVGAASDNGRITLGTTPPGAANAIIWHNLAYSLQGASNVYQGAFRVPSAPIQAGQFQLQAGSQTGAVNSGGILSGDFVGEVDSLRGIVSWEVAGLGLGSGDPVRADELTYNAVYLQYVPLDAELLGVDTSGLPADGRVPIFRTGGHVVVHHTDVFTLPQPVVKGTAYSVGRQRIASLVLRDNADVRLPGALYDVDRNAGTVTVKTGADISAYSLPLKAEHRVQDELQVLSADVSGKLVLAGALTHNYPLGSYVSSKLRQGDKFARVFGYADRASWLGSWAATEAGSDIGTASFNSVDYPITTTNRGAITERWAAIFTSSTQVRIVGEKVGQVLTAQPISGVIEAPNPQEPGHFYFRIPAAGWGGGFPVGGVLLFETQACGGGAWVARSVNPGGTEVLDDSAIFGFIANVDTP